MNTMTEESAMNRLANICSKGEYSKADIVEKLKKWGFDWESSQRIANGLVSSGFVDDERFCRAYVHDKYRLEKWGRLKIAQALSLKNIPSHIVRRSFNEIIDEEEYIGILRGVLNEKRRTTTGKTKMEIKAKLIRFAASRGYEMDCITSLLGETAAYEEE